MFATLNITDIRAFHMKHCQKPRSRNGFKSMSPFYYQSFENLTVHCDKSLNKPADYVEEQSIGVQTQPSLLLVSTYLLPNPTSPKKNEKLSFLLSLPYSGPDLQICALRS
jgi:hypothetical protein